MKKERGFPLCKYYGCKCKCNEHESITKVNSDIIEHLREREKKKKLQVTKLKICILLENEIIMRNISS